MVLLTVSFNTPCESIRALGDVKAAYIEGRRVLRGKVATLPSTQRALAQRLLRGYKDLENTLPKCMPAAGTTCALSKGLLLDILPDTDLQLPRDLSFPQLLYSKEAAAAVRCPDLWDKECVDNPACKWEPNEKWCDIDPDYTMINSYCEGSIAREYFECAYTQSQNECEAKGKGKKCFFHEARESEGPKCLPVSLKEDADEDIDFLEFRLSMQPLHPQLYGCCEGLALVNRHQMCSFYKDQDTCDNAQTRPLKACLWDEHRNRCIADSVKLIIDVFSSEKDLVKTLQEEADACANTPLSSCQSKTSFRWPDDDLLEMLVDANMSNAECADGESVGAVGLLEYPPGYDDNDSESYSPPGYDDDKKNDDKNKVSEDQEVSPSPPLEPPPKPKVKGGGGGNQPSSKGKGGSRRQRHH